MEWDANGAMYVAEMRSYMQDENGTGTKELRNGRINVWSILMVMVYTTIHCIHR